MVQKLYLERRLTSQLVSYWERLRGDRMMPSEDEVNPEDLAELWASCFLVAVPKSEGGTFEYAYLGSNIVEAYRGEISDNDTSIVKPNPAQLAADFKKVMELKTPVLDEGSFSNLGGGTVKYRQCMLPLGDGDRIDTILGGMRFRIFK